MKKKIHIPWKSSLANALIPMSKHQSRYLFKRIHKLVTCFYAFSRNKSQVGKSQDLNARQLYDVTFVMVKIKEN